MNKDDYNLPIVINFDSNSFEGHWILEEVEYEPIGDKARVLCRPIDVRLGKSIIFPKGYQELKKTYKRLLEKGCRKAIAGSAFREIIIYTPDNPTAFHDGVKDLNVGLFLSITRALETEQDVLGRILKERNLSQQQLMELMASGEANDWMMKRFTENLKGLVEVTVQKTVSQAIQQKPEDQQQKRPDNLPK